MCYLLLIFGSFNSHAWVVQGSSTDNANEEEEEEEEEEEAESTPAPAPPASKSPAPASAAPSPTPAPTAAAVSGSAPAPASTGSPGPAESSARALPLSGSSDGAEEDDVAAGAATDLSDEAIRARLAAMGTLPTLVRCIYLCSNRLFLSFFSQ